MGKAAAFSHLFEKLVLQRKCLEQPQIYIYIYVLETIFSKVKRERLQQQELKMKTINRRKKNDFTV